MSHESPDGDAPRRGTAHVPDAPIRVVLVDDQELYRTGFRMVLDSRPEVEVVGEADDGDTALALLAGTEADVVLMDVRMPRLDGVEATRRLRAADGPRVLVLTTFDLDEYAYEAIRAGASGFLLKDAPLEELLAAIAHVHAGDAVMAPSTTRRLLERFAGAPQDAAPAARTSPSPDRGADAPWVAADLEVLTDREREVLGQVADGLSNGEIADRLGIAESTVRVHVARMLTKLGLRDRVQAVISVHRWGLPPVGGSAPR